MRRAAAFLVTFALVILLVTSTSAQSDKIIRIGALFPFSGSLALLGQETFNGAELAREIINERGGINGRRIEWVKGDAVDVNAAVAEAERLITTQGVKVIFGTYSSSLSYAAAPVAERHKVIYWEQGAIADPIVEQGFKNLFRTCPSASQIGSGAVKMLTTEILPRLKMDPAQTKCAIVYEDSLYGTTVGTSFAAQAVKAGFKVVLTESYSSKSIDLSSLVLRLKAAKPDVIFAVTYIEDGIIFYRQLEAMDVNARVFIGSGTLFVMPTFYETFGSKTEYVIAFDSPTTAPAAAVKGADPSVTEWRERFKAKYGHYPMTHATLGYTGAMVLFQNVLPNATSLEPEAIRKAALAVDLPAGTLVNGCGVKFAGPDHPNAGQNTRAFMEGFQWQNGQMKIVWPKEVAEAELVVPFPTWKERKAGK